ncbi:beta-N-acetylhexosaminidase Bhx3B [Butyrivibrio proteoclasticus B316]|uniref:beta-N-acetylhexosaminidase n=1 Tax=Butyrivibrio proteoclasticus (strain ATCC 51982 / DSM 14932 / B316) TaxID=515622 RepID=E0RVB2_BUTPB|nr:glycoside hydrolase family 3 N-terminal domain-containing protein [Butyrivibrio proteoclasticus]ADL34531.1 beta-N-acetylhexosaminidase Bhx3B [Butyrivibrio proteoclasticus B316]
MGRIDEQDFDEKRLARRQRRKKSQLIAIIILISTIVLIVGLGAFGIYSIKKVVNAKKAEQEEAAAAASSENQEVVIETPQESAPEPEEMTDGDVLEEIVNSCVSELTLEDKVAGLFMVSPEQFTGVATVVKAGTSTQDALSKYAVGGLYYSAKNIKSVDQITEMIKNTSDMSKYPIFTAVSEDGSENGAITASIGGIETGEINNSDTAYNAGTSIGAALFGYGFNFCFAPDLDISENGKYGTEMESVADIAVSMTSALHDSGVTACTYRFPVSGDTKSAAVANEISKEELTTTIYVAYQRAIGDGQVGAVMMSNVSFPTITGDNTPASLSKVMITDELRGMLGYDGLVVTAPLNEAAITENYTSAEAAVNAINAGADMIFLPENFEEAYQGVLDAVNSGAITEDRINESIKRIYRLKYANKIDEIK